MRELRGKRVWVSGASGALGAQAVETLLALSCDVVASARRRTRLLDLRAELRNHERLRVAENDASDPKGVEALLDGLFRDAPLDIAIQCVGAFHYGPLEETSDADVSRLIAANLESSMWLLRGCLKRMQPRGAGQILLVGADVVHAPAAETAAYGATKAALAHLVQAVHARAWEHGVRVMALMPGTLDTEANRAGGLDPSTTPMLPLREVTEAMVRLLCTPADQALPALIPLEPSGVSAEGEA